MLSRQMLDLQNLVPFNLKLLNEIIPVIFPKINEKIGVEIPFKNAFNVPKDIKNISNLSANRKREK